MALLLVDALVGLVALRRVTHSGLHHPQVYRAAPGAVMCSSPQGVALYQAQPALRSVLRCRALAEGIRVVRTEDRGASLGLWKIYETGHDEGSAWQRGWAHPGDLRRPDGLDAVGGPRA